MLLPVLGEYQTQRSQAEVKRLISNISGSLGLVLVLFTVLGVVFAEEVIRLFAFGYVYQEQQDKLKLATDMLRLTFPYVLLICMTAFAGSVLNSMGRFAVPAFTPVLLNLSLIVSALVLSPLMAVPVHALAWGVLIAGIVQFCFQLPFLKQQGVLVAPRIGFQEEGVKRVMVLMVPALFAVSVGKTRQRLCGLV